MKNLILFLIFGVVSVFAAVPKIAVMPFSGADKTPDLAFLSKVLGDAFGTALVQQGQAVLVERQQLSAFLQNHQLEDALGNSELSADLAGSDMILVGSFGGTTSKLHVEARLVHSQTAKVLSSQSIDGPMDEIFKQIPQVSEYLLKIAKGDELGTILVKSDPIGARILIDGKEMGQTPKTLSMIPTGTHHVVLSKPNTQGCEIDVVVSTGQVTVAECQLKSALDQWLFGLYVEPEFYLWELGEQRSKVSIAPHFALGFRYSALGLVLDYKHTAFDSADSYSYQYDVPSEMSPHQTQERRIDWNRLGAELRYYPIYHCQSFCPYLGSSLAWMNLRSKAKDSVYHSADFGSQVYVSGGFGLGIDLFPRSAVGLHLGAKTHKVFGFRERQLQEIDYKGRVLWDDRELDLWTSSLNFGIRFGIGL